MQKISIVTGTLNRKPYLTRLLDNTIRADQRLELVLVDGGSTDGTIEMMEYISSVEPRLKFIQVGQRSPYPHYMNLGIKNASHENVCQWNDDILLTNEWQKVFDEIDDEHDAYLFNWKEGDTKDIQNDNWLRCEYMRDNGWNLHNCADYNYPNPIQGEIVMNYGIYKKDVFKKYGLYNNEYQYYCADGEMSMRAYYGGAKFKTCTNIKVCVLPAEKRAIMDSSDISRYRLACREILTRSYRFSGEFLI